MFASYNPPELGDFSASGTSVGAGTEELVYALGLAIDAETGRRRADAATVGDETRVCFDNIRRILAEAGLGLADIAKTTCYLQDEEHRFEFFEAYKEHFGDGPYPARVTVIVGIASDCRVQIEAIAVPHDAQ
ncbi:RidA family protein [Mycolicibacterium litorale]|uniref:RidA family protein n=1 Tax=Mycolicibacterium litorale TaxID=758802 RepID=UPI003CECC4BE